MAKKLTYDDWEQNKLVYGPGDEDYVMGGGEFTVTDEQALELLTNPHIPIMEEQAELTKLTRKQLEEHAADRGVDDPSSFATKEHLVAAIENQPERDQSRELGETIIETLPPADTGDAE